MKTPNNNLKELENKMKGKYLTEEWLGEILKALYPSQEWLHDERFKLKEKTYNVRPDYCCHALKKCIEFDGPDHFTKANVIQADIKKDELLSKLGYEVIRIPYFVQLDEEAIEFFFNLEVDFNYEFEHGFISKSIILPASFCEQGVWKFKEFLFKLSQADKDNICLQIKRSLKDKIESSKLPEETAMITTVPSILFSDFGLSNSNYENKKSFNDLIQNSNIINSNLQNNWNCVILESAQNVLQLGYVYDMMYTYSAEGNLSGYSFRMLHNNKVQKYTILIEKDLDEDGIVSISNYIDGELVCKKYEELLNVNVFNIMEFFS